jgi:hypothetical protein
MLKVINMSDKSELKAELERKKQRLAQIREEKKRKEEERKKKEVCLIKKKYTQCKISGFLFQVLIPSCNDFKIVKNLAVVTENIPL